MVWHITIFKAGFELRLSARFRNCFAHDRKVLVEDFVAGKEYRFFVIEGQTVAILHREPANVVGDGVQNIRELVTVKTKTHCVDLVMLHLWKNPTW